MMLQRRLCVRGPQQCEPLTPKGELNCAVLHHPTLTSDQIARESKVKHARLLKYGSESQTDMPPADVLVRVCAFLNNWRPLDAFLRPFNRRTVAIGATTTGASPLDEAIDVQTVSSALLKAVRDLGAGGFDAHETCVIERLCVDLHSEIDQVLNTIRSRRQA